MNRVHRFSTRLVLSASLLGSALLGVAVTTAAPVDAEATLQLQSTTLVEYLRGELETRDEARKQRALTDVIVLANCRTSCTVAFQSIPDQMLRIENEAGVGTAVDLTGLVPDLLNVYQTAKMDGTQLLALAALIDIGNEKSLETLISSASTRSPRIAQVTRKRVAAFFVNRYPELEERALRSRTFTLADVERARLNQKREQRKAMKRG